MIVSVIRAIGEFIGLPRIHVVVGLAVLLGAGDAAGGRLQHVPSIVDMQAFGSASASIGTVTVGSYNVGVPGGGGMFSYTPNTIKPDNCINFTPSSGGGTWVRKFSGPLVVSMCGAKCEGTQVNDGVSTKGETGITSATATWTPSMVGWVAVVNNAATSSKQLVTTVASVSSAGRLNLATVAGASGTAETVSLYPDDTIALDAAMNLSASQKLDVTLPRGKTCGYANPGSRTSKAFYTRTFYLNGGTLWLGQTGPVTDTGVSLGFYGKGAVLAGPGTIDGLYQTDQGVPQNLATAVYFQSPSSPNAKIFGNVIVQNTKGRAVALLRPNNFTISGLTLKNCGDYQYVPPTGDVETGRSMCFEATGPTGFLNVSNFSAINAAQAGVLVDNASDARFRFSLKDAYFYGNAYYGLDLEQINGSVSYSNLTIKGNGQAHSRSFVFGGIQILNVANVAHKNVTIDNIDSNGLVAQTISHAGFGNNIKTWTFSDTVCSGTPTRHACAIYISVGSAYPERIVLNNLAYDTLQFAPQGAPRCVSDDPNRAVFQFNNIRASNRYSGTATTFSPQIAKGSMFYVRGTDSNLGTFNIASRNNNNKGLYFDWSQVHMDGPITFAGSRAPAIMDTAFHKLDSKLRGRLASFSCPP